MKELGKARAGRTLHADHLRLYKGYLNTSVVRVVFDAED